MILRAAILSLCAARAAVANPDPRLHSGSPLGRRLLGALGDEARNLKHSVKATLNKELDLATDKAHRAISRGKHFLGLEDEPQDQPTGNPPQQTLPPPPPPPLPDSPLTRTVKRYLEIYGNTPAPPGTLAQPAPQQPTISEDEAEDQALAAQQSSEDRLSPSELLQLRKLILQEQVALSKVQKNVQEVLNNMAEEKKRDEEERERAAATAITNGIRIEFLFPPTSQLEASAPELPAQTQPNPQSAFESVGDIPQMVFRTSPELSLQDHIERVVAEAKASAADEQLGSADLTFDAETPPMAVIQRNIARINKLKAAKARYEIKTHDFARTSAP